jgi:hypothetical protein
MSLSKHFLSNRLSDLENSKIQSITGAVLGFLTAIAFYCLCNIVRDVFRFMVIDEEVDSWFLSENQKFFYNLIFGYISAILGQTITINYLFHKTKQFYRKRKFRLMDTRVNQNFITWNTLF